MAINPSTGKPRIVKTGVNGYLGLLSTACLPAGRGFGLLIKRPRLWRGVLIWENI